MLTLDEESMEKRGQMYPHPHPCVSASQVKGKNLLELGKNYEFEWKKNNCNRSFFGNWKRNPKKITSI
jgi:hypothetical protein